MKSVSDRKSGHSVGAEKDPNQAQNAVLAQTPSRPGDTSSDMIGNTASFRHEPLSRERDQIRLLRLSLSQKLRDLPFELSLMVTDVELAPPFAALSYEWGSTDDLKTIYIDDRAMQIRQNLFSFLERCKGMDLTKSDAYIWIDQICINQDSLEERNHQVQLMARIYSSAEEVLVWLGVHPRATEIFALARNFDFKDRDRLSGPEISLLHLLHDLSYWSRHWIAQEVFLSRRCTVFLGTVDMPWTTLLDFVLNSPQGGASSSLYRLTMLCSPKGLRSANMKHAQFGDIMAFAAESKCCDPRDKVFGIQSILEVETQIEVDYHLSTEQVFCEAMFLYLHKLYNVSEWTLGGGLTRLAQGMGLIPWTMDHRERGTLVQMAIGRVTEGHRETRFFLNPLPDDFHDTIVEALLKDLPCRANCMAIWYESRPVWARKYSIEMKR